MSDQASEARSVKLGAVVDLADEIAQALPDIAAHLGPDLWEITKVALLSDKFAEGAAVVETVKRVEDLIAGDARYVHHLAIRRAIDGPPQPDAAQVAEPAQALVCCHASRGDGECIAVGCPQIRDGEPAATGRTCPLPWITDDEDGV